jgi:hypothetical protein
MYHLVVRPMFSARAYTEEMKEGVMARRTVVFSVVILVVVLLSSCTKLPEAEVKVEGRFGMEMKKLEGTIPSTWGNVISVSSIGQFPGWVQLWFQDATGNVYMIPYHVESNVFHENYRYLKRQ